MSDTQNYLDTFPSWLKSLGEDAEHIAALLGDQGVEQSARETLAGGLNYLFKTLDLIPDGVDDIGYLDDAFVLRVSADLALREGMLKGESSKVAHVEKLAGECDMLKEFLDSNYTRLETYVKGLRKGAARGRSVDDIIKDERVRTEFLSDVRGFAKSYESPSFAREEKVLIKLRAFFDAKLPK
ncbi:MAG: DUF1232 domain-containing protein [Sandaracinaceae bacterium]|jgi:uncharacterized membrane protein YkvA (DUF1232 family)|nr:DUF1232 domain-containing protein [Sandaracinaceae bacterium]